MRIALIAPPFIPVPPEKYGGTELFVADLATGLFAMGHDVIVYANGESRLPCEVRWRYDSSDWPPQTIAAGSLKTLDHLSWAFADAAGECDVIHFNDVNGVFFTRLVDTPTICTLHHPHEPELSGVYEENQHIAYVAISGAQLRRERLANAYVVHHGIDLDRYNLVEEKRDYLAFLGRFAPCKGAHRAIQVARLAGMPLKLAGEIQPVYRDYWDAHVAPYIDGSLIEYIGEADLATKNELLGQARALLFPIDWEEPFGLVMIEAMACGTPVLALPGGAVDEVVRNGVSGYVCGSVDELAAKAQTVSIDASQCREYVAQSFSLQRMASDYAAIYRRICTRVDPAKPGGMVGASAWTR